jgi:hypothetical protein
MGIFDPKVGYDPVLFAHAVPASRLALRSLAVIGAWTAAQAATAAFAGASVGKLALGLRVTDSSYYRAWQARLGTARQRGRPEGAGTIRCSEVRIEGLEPFRWGTRFLFVGLVTLCPDGLISMSPSVFALRSRRTRRRTSRPGVSRPGSAFAAGPASPARLETSPTRPLRVSGFRFSGFPASGDTPQCSRPSSRSAAGPAFRRKSEPERRTGTSGKDNGYEPTHRKENRAYRIRCPRVHRGTTCNCTANLASNVDAPGRSNDTAPRKPGSARSTADRPALPASHRGPPLPFDKPTAERVFRRFVRRVHITNRRLRDCARRETKGLAFVRRSCVIVGLDARGWRASSPGMERTGDAGSTGCVR